MKLAGTVSDPKAIHAKFGAAFCQAGACAQPGSHHRRGRTGGSNAQLVLGMVKNGAWSEHAASVSQ